MSRITRSEIEQLRAFNRQFEQSLKHHQVFDSMEHDEAFHELIIELADNHYITDFVAILQMHIRRLKYRFFAHALPGEQSIQDHNDIIDAFELQDTDRLAVSMESNWLRPMRELEKALQIDPQEK